MKNKNIIRTGDIVRIINPEFFIRCGYNLCLKDLIDKFEKERMDEIENFIDVFLGDEKGKNELIKLGIRKTNPKEFSRTGKEIAKALAYAYMIKHSFGGKERKIFTERKEEYINTDFMVCDIRYHKTGIYFPPSGGYDSYFNEYDYESGGLKNEKTHKILELFPVYNNPKFVSVLSPTFKIESIHVEKINEE
jgi:hypothetical protein